MELNISEVEYNEDIQTLYNYDKSSSSIPENNAPIKVIKKGVRFTEPIKPMNHAIPRVNARMVRPQIPKPKPQISYEDILSKMGVFVSDGKLHLIDKGQEKQKQNNIQRQQNSIPQNSIPQNSYIYNKYFKDEIKPEENIRRPLTKAEYKKMLIKDILQKYNINQIKSTRLLMPTSNINIAPGNQNNLNKLFNFSKR